MMEIDFFQGGGGWFYGGGGKKKTFWETIVIEVLGARLMTRKHKKRFRNGKKSINYKQGIFMCVISARIEETQRFF